MPFVLTTAHRTWTTWVHVGHQRNQLCSGGSQDEFSSLCRAASRLQTLSRVTVVKAAAGRRWELPLSDRNHPGAGGLVCNKDENMDKTPPAAGVSTGKQIPPKRHDPGSGANETTDGLDPSSEALRRAAEDTPSGATPEDVETVPVFDRADLAPKI